MKVTFDDAESVWIIIDIQRMGIKIELMLLLKLKCKSMSLTMAKKKKLQILMPTWRVNSFDKGYHFFLEFKFINLLVQEKKISLKSYVFLITDHFF